jgi:hypothetical protein
VEVIFEILFEFAGELILNLVAGLLGEVFEAGVRRRVHKPQGLSPLAECAMALVLGGAAALVTLWLLPSLAVRGSTLQMLNLLGTPLVAATVGERVRAWRAGSWAFQGSVWLYAWLFASAFCGMRYLFGV